MAKHFCVFIITNSNIDDAALSIIEKRNHFFLYIKVISEFTFKFYAVGFYHFTVITFYLFGRKVNKISATCQKNFPIPKNLLTFAKTQKLLQI